MVLLVVKNFKYVSEFNKLAKNYKLKCCFFYSIIHCFCYKMAHIFAVLVKRLFDVVEQQFPL